ncbi:TPA: hypothetical protein SIF56_004480 [Escherichia coli]|nr:hypothetical protein [Escherichia coli]
MKSKKVIIIDEEMSSNHKWQESITDLYPPIAYRSGAAPHKRGYCGFCATATHKQQTKLDSCPECGVSYMKYGRK